MRPSFFRLVHRNLAGHTITEKEKKIAATLIAAATETIQKTCSRLGTSPDGLKASQAATRLETYGHNVVVEDKTRPWWLQLLSAFKSPFNLVLLVLATVSWITHDYTAVSIIMVMVLASVFLKFIEEYRSGKGAEALRKMVRTTITVVRKNSRGKPTENEIPIDRLVPGDIVTLAAGDVIPADLRILQSKDLFVSQSALTGEALPVDKQAAPIAEGTVKNALELQNICFMGTSVNIGTATAVVLATGTQTYFGSMAESLMQTHNRTSFDISISKVSWLLIGFMAVMVPVVFFISGFTKGNWLDALMFALSVAVGLTPEMLPMIVTSNLAKGALRMARHKVIVKKLSAIQDFGAMNILCTDKTGTLTENRIVLMRYTDVFLDESIDTLHYAWLNSHFETGLSDVMDRAILDSKFIKNKNTLATGWRKLDELPFDFERRRMSVVLGQDDKQMLICKGAIEEMLAFSDKIATSDGEKQVTDSLARTIRENAASLNRDGLRVIAVGHKYFPENHADTYTVDDEKGLVLDGFVSFLDPPKESAREAIETLTANGIRVMVLTGDNDIVAQKVCAEVGLTEERVILGSDIEELADDKALELIDGHRVFAKLSPMQKSRIVGLLRSGGNIVGYMGDGINDAVSLREADIGISVDTAVNIAKTSADIILLEKSLMVLDQGVIEGRKMFANTMKYIKITASSNFGNVLSLLGASALFPFLPMLPIQILILNLIYDLSQIVIPWDNVDAEYIKKPRRWAADDIKRFMLVMGPVSSVFDYVTFAVLFFVFAANSATHQAVFQTGWFTESLFSQMLAISILRTEKIPFLQSRPSLQWMLSALVLLSLGAWLPYTGLGRDIGFGTLPLAYYGWLAMILLAYCTAAQLVKRLYIRRFGSWL